MGKRDKSPNFNRFANTREERKTLDSRELLTFSFKDLDQSQPKQEPQTLDLWENEKLLNPFMARLRELSQLTRTEAEQQQQIKIYGDFPASSNFSQPRHVDPHVSWGVIQSVGGQKGRVAGYIAENTFYVVFLDKNHEFWLSKKKHT